MGLLLLSGISSFGYAQQDSSSLKISSVSSTSNQITSSTDLAIVYARKIESLIALKGESVRASMIITMRKFLTKFSSSHPLYSTIVKMTDIIRLGEFAHKVEYCTQYDESYRINLFDTYVVISSRIKYNPTINKCIVSFAYPDKSVQRCNLSDNQKTTLSNALIKKQGLRESQDDSLEYVLEGWIAQQVCIEQ